MSASTKKGRGRPKKTETPAAPVADTEDVSSAEEAAPEPAPKKAKVAPKAAAEEPAEAPKRGRGRPKKANKKPAKTTVPGRGRGRAPTKNAAKSD